MKLNKTNKRFKAFLAGTATLLTLLATTATAAKADSTANTVAESTVDAAAASSEKSVKPAKEVVLDNHTSTSVNSESSANSNSFSTASSASQSSSTASSNSTSSDTTDQESSASSSSESQASKSDPVNVKAAAKSDNAETSKQQTVTQQYTPKTTSQNGSDRHILPKASLMKLSLSEFTALAAQAKLAADDVSVSDAVVTDSTGKVYSADDVLSLYAGYIATIQWSIKDGVPVKAGDTMTINLPKNVLFTANTTAVNIANAANQSIGTFSAKAGTQTGTLTFNNYFELNNVSSRQGTLMFHVTGTDTNIGDDKAKINKVGWWLSDGKSIEWQIVVNLGSEDWNSVEVVDQLGQYQKHNSEITFESGAYINGSFVSGSYVDGSFVRSDPGVSGNLGKYDLETGVFTPAKGVSPKAVSISVVGNQMTIELGDISTAINIYYSVATEAPDQIYTNSATANYKLPSTTDPGDGGTTTPGGGDSGNSGNTPDDTNKASSSPFLASGAVASADWHTYTLFVTKTDKDTGVAVPDAVYELQTTDGLVLQSGLKTDKNGQLTISNLAAGTYQLVETAAPNGYLLDKTAHVIVIDPHAATTVDGVNTYRVSEPVTDTAIPTTSLAVKKVWVNMPVGTKPSVTVTLFLNDNSTSQTLKLTAENGYQGSFDNLPTSDANGKLYAYTVQESAVDDQKAALADYAISQVKDGNMVTLTNTYRTITVTKTDESGNKLLAGATFTLTATDGSGFTQTQTTDENGQAVFAGLAQGTYQIQETNAPAGYTLNSVPTKVTLDSQTNYLTVAVKDAEIKGSLTVTKVDGTTNAKLAGATFELRDATTKQVVQTAVTDANGQLIFNDLALGTYDLVEVTAPTGYRLNTKSLQVVISADNTDQVQTVADDAIKGQLTITKVDSATGATLAGATFDLKDATGNVVATGTTDANGQLIFNDLAMGTYSLVETVAPTGYQLATKAQPVTLLLGDTTATVTVADTVSRRRRKNLRIRLNQKYQRNQQHQVNRHNRIK
ncbi:SpaA isopeptide-forming pilin-related protein [Lactiplantibacillus daoliensis]|uniref:SpaA isopeptide-forming pilin-related protein n=2 Tax=Lactiplantibacillus daoliensis TaxID=2559916 RepID=A0ABW1UHN6_9LACO